MATVEQIAELRRKINEPDATTWTDEQLNVLIDDADGDLNTVAAALWEEKAASYAELVDISEAGSSRKYSQLYTNALKMAAYYRGLGDAEDPEVPGVDYPTTTKIVRA